MAHALRYLIVLLSCAAGVLAATAPVQVVRFTVFSARPVQNVAFVPRADAAPAKLTFYPTARSHRHEFRGAMPLRFVDVTTGQVVAEATIPPGIGDALLLFLAIEPAPASGLRYQVAVLDDGAARHGPAGLAVVNFSGLELSGVIGRHAVLLKAGLNPTLPVSRSTRINLRTMVKDRTYQSYADQVELARNERALLLLFPPYYKGSLEVQSRVLIDEPPPPESTPPRP